MWLDSALIFLNDDWVPESAEPLDQYPVVQPFGWMTYLRRPGASAPRSCRLCRSARASAACTAARGLVVSQFGSLLPRQLRHRPRGGVGGAARGASPSAARTTARSSAAAIRSCSTPTGHYNGVSRKMPSGTRAGRRARSARASRRSSGRRTCRTRAASCCTSGTATAPTATTRTGTTSCWRTSTTRASTCGSTRRACSSGRPRSVAAPLAGGPVLQQRARGVRAQAIVEPLARGRRVDGAAAV